VATCKVDSYHVTRIKEMLTLGFAPSFLLSDFATVILEEHPVLVGEPFWHQASGKLMSSMHSWMIMAIKQASTPRAG
jgi:hypothetical protein